MALAPLENYRAKAKFAGVVSAAIGKLCVEPAILKRWLCRTGKFSSG
jgi:hypothetical protein